MTVKATHAVKLPVMAAANAVAVMAAVAAAPELRLAVSLETGDAVANLQAATGAGTDKGIAQLLAEDLVTCLGSYAQVVPGVGERIVLPPAALQAWLARVAEKTRADPNLLFLRKEQRR